MIDFMTPIKVTGIKASTKSWINREVIEIILLTEKL